MQEFGPGVRAYDTNHIRGDVSLFIPFSSRKKRPRAENYSDYAPALGSHQQSTTAPNDFVHTPAHYRTILRGTIVYTLDPVLRKFREFLIANIVGDDYVLPLEEDIMLTLPKNIPFTSIYYANANSFLKYFEAAFTVSFYNTIPAKSPLFPDVRVNFKVESSDGNILVDTNDFTITAQMYFRQVTCVLFKKLLALNLTCCSCIPSTPSEYVAWQSGIYKNCYNPTCSVWIQNHPNLYDSVFMGPCDSNMSASTAIAIAYVRTAASNGNNINIDIKQFLESASRNPPA